MFVKPIRPADTYFTTTQFEFGALRQSYELIEANLARLLNQRQLPSWDGQPSSSGKAVLARFHHDLVGHMIPDALRRPVVIGLCGVYEAALVEIGETVRLLSKQSSGAPPWNRDVIGRANKYLARFEITLHPSKTVGNQLMELYKLRNVLAHANGRRGATSVRAWDWLKVYARRTPGLEVQHGYISLSAEFVETRFDLVASALQPLLGQVRDWLHENGAR